MDAIVLLLSNYTRSMPSQELDPATRSARNHVLDELLTSLDRHSPGERGHAERVAVYSVAVAEKLGLTDDELLTIRYAATLHDIGKVRVDASLLSKLGTLSDDDLRAMRMHAVLAEAALTEYDWLAPCLPLIRSHHERWDGNGYPNGLRGAEIPIGARVINLAETFDVLVMRDGDPVMIEDLALAEIEACSGTQFDPDVVQAFLAVQPAIQPLIV